MSEISLVVLAAGMARRYGSLKQVAAVGPGDAALVDHTIADAGALGVARVVAVVRPEIRDEVVAHLARRCPTPLQVVEQPGPGPGRSRPWGASEAVALAAQAVPGPLVVANADDYYGPDALAAAVAWLGDGRDRGGCAGLVTWPLRATLSRRGAVTRATCALGEDGATLTAIEEREGITLGPDGTPTTPDGPLPPDVPTSMNLWALPPGLGPDLVGEVERFRATHGHDADAELPLPTALGHLVDEGRLSITTIPAGTTWVGITHPEDLDEVTAAMAARAPIPEVDPPAAPEERHP